MFHISHHANKLIKEKYISTDMLDVYEDLKHNENRFVSNLYIYYITSNGSKMIDNWYQYIDYKTYSCEEFLENSYFKHYIVPHLYIQSQIKSSVYI